MWERLERLLYWDNLWICKYVAEQCEKNDYAAVVACCGISSYDGEIEMWKSLEPGDWKGISHVCEHKGELLFDSAKNTHLKREGKSPCYSLDTYLRLNNIEHIIILRLMLRVTKQILLNHMAKVDDFHKIEHMHIDDINMRILEEQGYVVSELMTLQVFDGP